MNRVEVSLPVERVTKTVSFSMNPLTIVMMDEEGEL